MSKEDKSKKAAEKVEKERQQQVQKEREPEQKKSLVDFINNFNDIKQDIISIIGSIDNPTKNSATISTILLFANFFLSSYLEFSNTEKSGPTTAKTIAENIIHLLNLDELGLVLIGTNFGKSHIKDGHGKRLLSISTNPNKHKRKNNGIHSKLIESINNELGDYFLSTNDFEIIYNTGLIDKIIALLEKVLNLFSKDSALVFLTEPETLRLLLLELSVTNSPIIQLIPGIEKHIIRGVSTDTHIGSTSYPEQKDKKTTLLTRDNLNKVIVPHALLENVRECVLRPDTLINIQNYIKGEIIKEVGTFIRLGVLTEFYQNLTKNQSAADKIKFIDEYQESIPLKASGLHDKLSRITNQNNSERREFLTEALTETLQKETDKFKTAFIEEKLIEWKNNNLDKNDEDVIIYLTPTLPSFYGEKQEFTVQEYIQCYKGFFNAVTQKRKQIEFCNNADFIGKYTRKLMNNEMLSLKYFPECSEDEAKQLLVILVKIKELFNESEILNLKIQELKKMGDTNNLNNGQQNIELKQQNANDVVIADNLDNAVNTDNADNENNTNNADTADSTNVDNSSNPTSKQLAMSSKDLMHILPDIYIPIKDTDSITPEPLIEKLKQAQDKLFHVVNSLGRTSKDQRTQQVITHYQSEFETSLTTFSEAIANLREYANPYENVTAELDKKRTLCESNITKLKHAIEQNKKVNEDYQTDLERDITNIRNSNIEVTPYTESENLAQLKLNEEIAKRRAKYKIAAGVFLNIIPFSWIPTGIIWYKAWKLEHKPEGFSSFTHALERAGTFWGFNQTSTRLYTSLLREETESTDRQQYERQAGIEKRQKIENLITKRKEEATPEMEVITNLNLHLEECLEIETNNLAKINSDYTKFITAQREQQSQVIKAQGVGIEFRNQQELAFTSLAVVTAPDPIPVTIQEGSPKNSSEDAERSPASTTAVTSTGSMTPPKTLPASQVITSSPVTTQASPSAPVTSQAATSSVQNTLMMLRNAMTGRTNTDTSTHSTANGNDNSKKDETLNILNDDIKSTGDVSKTSFADTIRNKINSVRNNNSGRKNK